MTQLQTQVAELIQRLADGEAQRVSLEERMRQAEATASASRGASGTGVAEGARTRLGIDTRQLGKPEHFTGEDKVWRDWAIVFRSYASLVNPHLRDLMREAESRGVMALNSTMIEEHHRTASAELYHMLLNLVRGPALDKVVNCGEFEGVEAWRQLCDRYDAKVRTRHASQLLTLLQWHFSGDILTRLEQFEREIVLYQQHSSEAVSDNMRIGMVLNRLEDVPLREHLVMNSERLRVWKSFKDEIVNITRVRALSAAPGVVPMDVGAVQAKSGGKGRPCYNCGKPGHFAKDCRSAPAKGQGKASGGGGGKGGKGAGGRGGNSSAGTGTESRSCYKCGKKGHLAKDCRSKSVHAVDEQGETGQSGATEPDEENLELSGLWISCLDVESCNADSMETICGECRLPANRSWPSYCADSLAVHAVGIQKEKVRFGVDSGAALTVVQKHTGADYPLQKSVNRKVMRAANGEVIPDLGSRDLAVVGHSASGDQCQFLRATVAPVSKNLLSVSALVDAGHEVVFGPSESYYRHQKTGKKKNFQRINGVYELELELEPFSSAPEPPTRSRG